MALAGLLFQGLKKNNSPPLMLKWHFIKLAVILAQYGG